MTKARRIGCTLLKFLPAAIIIGSRSALATASSSSSSPSSSLTSIHTVSTAAATATVSTSATGASAVVDTQLSNQVNVNPENKSSLQYNNNNNNMKRTGSFKYIVFSDVDGTLVHYPDHLQNNQGINASHTNSKETSDEGMLLYLPPSKTGTRGVISTGTLKLCHLLRHGKHYSEYSSGADDNENKRMEDLSSTAVISSTTKNNSCYHLQRIDNGGVPFVLISGMRTTTLFQRLPFLPRADAYVSESGGRIFYPCPIPNGDKNDDDRESNNGETEGMVKGLIIRPVPYPGSSPVDLVPFSLREDMHWRKQISKSYAAGTDGFSSNRSESEDGGDGEIQITTPINSRKGKLWDYANNLINQGFQLDTHGYATSFRVNRKHQNKQQSQNDENDNDNHNVDFDEFLQKCSRKEGIPEGLDCSTNLGCVDIYPAMSGKKNGCEYLVRKFLKDDQDDSGDESSIISLKSNAFCMCDDDNDIEMALACKAAFLPSVTSESVRKLVENVRGSGESKLVVTEDTEKGIVETAATELALELVMKEVQKK